MSGFFLGGGSGRRVNLVLVNPSWLHAEGWDGRDLILVIWRISHSFRVLSRVGAPPVVLRHGLTGAHLVLNH